MASRMRDHDLLTRYQDWETIAASAARIGQRLRRENPLHKAGDLLLPLLPELEQSFGVFYPQLIEFSQRSVMLAATATEIEHD